MVEGSTIDEAEEFATASIFNRKIIHRGAMLVHSSALVFDGKAYLFSADSGVGKSTHTKMWLKRFGSKAHILNDDKPVVKLKTKSRYAAELRLTAEAELLTTKPFP